MSINVSVYTAQIHKIGFKANIHANIPPTTNNHSSTLTYNIIFIYIYYIIAVITSHSLMRPHFKMCLFTYTTNLQIKPGC